MFLGQLLWLLHVLDRVSRLPAIACNLSACISTLISPTTDVKQEVEEPIFQCVQFARLRVHTIHWFWILLKRKC